MRKRLLFVSIPAFVAVALAAAVLVEIWVRVSWDPSKGSPGFVIAVPVRLERLAPGYDSHDPLVYEKRMLDRWFRDRFAKGGKAP